MPKGFHEAYLKVATAKKRLEKTGLPWPLQVNYLNTRFCIIMLTGPVVKPGITRRWPR